MTLSDISGLVSIGKSTPARNNSKANIRAVHVTDAINRGSSKMGPIQGRQGSANVMAVIFDSAETQHLPLVPKMDQVESNLEIVQELASVC
jgi:hypothetical protein